MFLRDLLSLDGTVDLFLDRGLSGFAGLFVRLSLLGLSRSVPLETRFFGRCFLLAGNLLCCLLGFFDGLLCFGDCHLSLLDDFSGCFVGDLSFLGVFDSFGGFLDFLLNLLSSFFCNLDCLCLLFVGLDNLSKLSFLFICFLHDLLSLLYGGFGGVSSSVDQSFSFGNITSLGIRVSVNGTRYTSEDSKTKEFHLVFIKYNL